MKKTSRLVKFAVIVSLVMAVLAFVLDLAPFTPALALAVIAFPVAIGCSFSGVWWLSTITTYWSLAAFIAVPMSQNTGIKVDYTLVILGSVGLTFSAFLYVSYLRSHPTS
jgi:hypothetical protein